MTRYAQLVIGPAGSGKSTYCNEVFKWCEASRRVIHIVNLDPAAEYFLYPCMADIRDLIHLDDAMEDDELHLGPNGGLVFCMEYFSDHMDWVLDQLGEIDDDYFIFDCPGQIELYTHLDVMKKFLDQLQKWDFRICAVYLLDSEFLVDGSKAPSSSHIAPWLPSLFCMRRGTTRPTKDGNGSIVVGDFEVMNLFTRWAVCWSCPVRCRPSQ